MNGTPKREPYPPEGQNDHWAKGHYKDRAVTLAEPIAGLEECNVVVIFPEDDKRLLNPVTPKDWDHFHKIVREAHERHLTPKHENDPER